MQPMRRWATLLCVAVLLPACVIVPKNRRKHLADPTMQPTEDALRDRAHAKIHTAREGAAGGDGEPAGGGCGCSN
jgi:hypothetical protein